MKTRFALPLLLASVAAVFFLFQVETASSLDPVASDPGVRVGTPDAGDPIAGLSTAELAIFQVGKDEFEQVESIDEGLGPRMNLDACAGCHAQPATGGTSPSANPQVAFASANGATNRIPPFIRADGPVREARFVRNPDGTRDGGVHALFTLAGRADAAGCALEQPDFDAQLALDNVIFRIPTPVFGAGLIEQIPDRVILANQASHAFLKAALGISGRTNRNGNDGTIARFGWKAQNKSLLLFSGEAYNVEMGITNELFQTERDEIALCQFTRGPNNLTNVDAATPLEVLSAIERFAFFQRFLAAPTPSPDTPGGAASIASGRSLFVNVGCALCHTPALHTGRAGVAALRHQQVNLFSDLLLHDMGVGLADGILQGQAGPREFRTAPLWGLGQRIFFLHDGRTSDVAVAIQAHRSFGSEANAVVRNFNYLWESQKQDIFNFLRSL
ncbi:MAG TPA: di-heme oxidoredictase family protein [Burkholderiales bacterium]|nr:di-heme oxidoredictase family protein [Burkholderiales bacterium]